MEKKKILFISHTFPPITGGVETQNYELSKHLSEIAEVRLIANRHRFLIPFFLAYAALPALFLKYDVLVLGSCILGNVGWVTKKFRNKPVIAVAHGLDLTWKNPLYQKLWLKVFLPSLDKLIAVGNETIRVGMGRGLASEKLVFIPNGVDTEKHLGSHSRVELEKVVGEKLDGKKVLLTSGRLARRKGVAWFIQNVMHELPKNVIYVVAGDGPDREYIQKAIRDTGTQSRVKLLGYVSDEIKNLLLNTADLFIQPNIQVEGDIEGFGISVIEATACRLPVIAARLEGLQDAIKDEQNGFLVESGNARAFIDKITYLLDNEALRKDSGEKARRFTIDHYSWNKIARRYLEEIEKVTSNQ